MNEELVFKTEKISENEIFLTLRGYDELFTYQPIPLDPDEENPLGTYMTKIGKGNGMITYRVYHYRLFNGMKSWFKLPSINYIDGNYLTESSTVLALKESLTEDDCKGNKELENIYINLIK